MVLEPLWRPVFTLVFRIMFFSLHLLTSVAHHHHTARLCWPEACRHSSELFHPLPTGGFGARRLQAGNAALEGTSRMRPRPAAGAHQAASLSIEHLSSLTRYQKATHTSLLHSDEEPPVTEKIRVLRPWRSFWQVLTAVRSGTKYPRHRHEGDLGQPGQHGFLIVWKTAYAAKSEICYIRNFM